jgi:hypothetical protein
MSLPWKFTESPFELIDTDFIESDLKSLGSSNSGIDALIPEALGNCCSKRVTIFNETSFSTVITPPKKKSAVTAIAMRALDFLNI